MLRSFLAVCAALSALIPIAVAAATANAPIEVHRCEPVEGTTTVGGYMPGYYPLYGPYYWRDPYGYRYRQYPYPATVSTTSPALNIDFVNVTPRAVKEVEFGLVARGSLIAEVRDVGTFSQGAEIRHRFGLNPNAFPIGTGLPQCLPLRVTYSDGSVWTSPHLPKLRAGFYR